MHLNVLFFQIYTSSILFSSVICKAVNDSVLLAIRNNILTANWPSYKRLETVRKPFDYNWQNFTQDIPIAVIFVEFHWIRVGNILGDFFTSYGCAYRSGAHIIIINTGDVDMPVWANVPMIVINQNAASDYNAMYDKYRRLCPIKSDYPWDDEGPWRKISQSVYSWRAIFRPAMDFQMSDHFLKVDLKTTILPHSSVNSSDVPDLRKILSKSEYHSLPMYPDVTIHYRCSDNICNAQMGLLPFNAVLDHIPHKSKYIFIVTEGSTHRNYENPICRPIVEALASDIRRRFPHAHVVVRYGGSVLLAMAMLMYSRVTICSSSTFCFFTACLNSEGTVYLPSRHFYGSYFEVDNVHTMKNSKGISMWMIDKSIITHRTGCALNLNHVKGMLKMLRDPKNKLIQPQYRFPTIELEE